MTPPDAEAVPQFTFVYRNYKGEVSERHVRPISIRFGSTEWHPMPQWLLLAYDIDRKAEREFAMRDMAALGWRPPPAGEAGEIGEVAEACEAAAENWALVALQTSDDASGEFASASARRLRSAAYALRRLPALEAENAAMRAAVEKARRWHMENRVPLPNIETEQERIADLTAALTPGSGEAALRCIQEIIRQADNVTVASAEERVAIEAARRLFGAVTK